MQCLTPHLLSIWIPAWTPTVLNALISSAAPHHPHPSYGGTIVLHLTSFTGRRLFSQVIYTLHLLIKKRKKTKKRKKRVHKGETRGGQLLFPTRYFKIKDNYCFTYLYIHIDIWISVYRCRRSSIKLPPLSGVFDCVFEKRRMWSTQQARNNCGGGMVVWAQNGRG